MRKLKILLVVLAVIGIGGFIFYQVKTSGIHYNTSLLFIVYFYFLLLKG